VIGAKGMLTGYAGTKTDLKAVLLDLEKISYQE
jgi:methylated-DNA-[protein]-cysteine S-methyltransferase